MVTKQELRGMAVTAQRSQALQDARNQAERAARLNEQEAVMARLIDDEASKAAQAGKLTCQVFLGLVDDPVRDRLKERYAEILWGWVDDGNDGSSITLSWE